MPGLDLSSNWKKLQATLPPKKQSEPASNGVKRKRSSETGTVRHKKGPKATGDNLAPLGKKRKMGGYMSTNPQPQTSRSALLSQHDIPPSDLSAAYGAPTPTDLGTTKFQDVINGGLHPTHKAGKYLSLDCEMVGTGPPPHTDDVLARVSLVNFHGEQIYDSYVQAPARVKVEDYRTFVSGIKPLHMRPGFARTFEEVQQAVATLLKDRVLVGHALKKDLQVLILNHSQRDIRDTSRYPKFRVESRGKPPALRKLALSELGLVIQTGEHSSIEDARATMMLFRKEKAGFEEENRKIYGQRGPLRKPEKKAVVQDEEGESEEEDDDEEEDELDTLDGEEDDAPDYFGEGAKRMESGGQAKKKRKKKKRTKRK